MKTHEAPPLAPRLSQPSWLASHRRLRRTLLASAIFITLIALGYTVENWRGKRAWAQYKHDTEARGLSLDWNAYIPPPVPDDQNFFKAPNMQEWFTGRGEREIYKHLSFNSSQNEFSDHLPSAEVTIVPANARVAPESADLVLQYNTPLLSLADQNQPVSVSATPPPVSELSTLRVRVQTAAKTELQKWVQLKLDAMGQPEPHPDLTDIAGIPLTRQTLPPIPPLRLVIRSDRVPSAQEIKDFFLGYHNGAMWWSYDVMVTGSNTFRASLPLPYIPAADYLRWSNTCKDDFGAIAEALKRPYARMEGDYEHPFSIPIPNFVCIRMLGQSLALRAQSYLLLGEPEKALHELTLMNDLSRMMEARPTGKPMTLIAAMINVAVKGLYVGVIADGMRLHAWREPHLAALQAQLAQTDLLPLVNDAFKFETISFGHIVESSSSRELADTFSSTVKGMSVRQKLNDPTYDLIRFAPRGWLYQNAIVTGNLKRGMRDSFDLTNHLVLPRNVDKQTLEVERVLRQHSPYVYFARILIPNYVHTVQTAARNQTLVNEAFIVCALERHHLAYGHYPESLDALVPRFAATLPKDIIGGGPLKYYNVGSQFVLYSIGWNEKDDNGKPSFDAHLTGDLTQNDWAWPYQESNSL